MQAILDVLTLRELRNLEKLTSSQINRVERAAQELERVAQETIDKNVIFIVQCSKAKRAQRKADNLATLRREAKAKREEIVAEIHRLSILKAIVGERDGICS